MLRLKCNRSQAAAAAAAAAAFIRKKHAVSSCAFPNGFSILPSSRSSMSSMSYLQSFSSQTLLFANETAISQAAIKNVSNPNGFSILPSSRSSMSSMSYLQSFSSQTLLFANETAIARAAIKNVSNPNRFSILPPSQSSMSSMAASPLPPKNGYEADGDSAVGPPPPPVGPPPPLFGPPTADVPPSSEGGPDSGDDRRGDDRGYYDWIPFWLHWRFWIQEEGAFIAFVLLTSRVLYKDAVDPVPGSLVRIHSVLLEKVKVLLLLVTQLDGVAGNVDSLGVEMKALQKSVDDSKALQLKSASILEEIKAGRGWFSWSK